MGNPDQLNITVSTPEQEAVLREITAWSGVPVLARRIGIVVCENCKTFAGATGFSFNSDLISDTTGTGYTFLHEYGHTWDRHWLSIEDRQAIIDLNGSPYSWYGGPYNERPAEKFADWFAKLTMADAGYHVGAPLAFSGPLFTDSGHTSQEMQAAIVWLYNQGITKGTSITTFSPDEPATRGQVALFFYRAFGS